jgi:plastocyanin
VKTRQRLAAAFAAFALSLVPPGPATAEQPAPDQAETIDNFAFLPPEVVILAGTTVTWTNAQLDVAHTSTSDTGVWDSRVLNTGDAFSFSFDAEGEFPYHCTIHPFMRGVVRVVSDPAQLSVSDAAEDD